MDGPLGESESELVAVRRVPLSFSRRNILASFSSGQVIRQHVSDCADIIEQVEAGLEASEYKSAEYARFIRHLSQSKDELLTEVIGKRPDPVELKEERAEKAADEFFDAPEQQEKQAEFDKDIEAQI